MRPFLVIAVVCLALFIVAGFFVGDLIPSFWQAPRKVTTRSFHQAPSVWPLVQNLSALVGLVSFFIQVVQWRRNR